MRLHFLTKTAFSAIIFHGDCSSLSLWRTIENVFLLFQSLNLKLGTIALYSFGLYALFFIRTEEFFNDAMHV